MTDITELAQREKFEAWAHSQKLSLAYGDCGYAFSSTEMAWRAWRASSSELVEALEKAQRAIEAMEVAADPHDPLEWADMQFLLWDAQRRMGISDEFITRAMVEKLAINKARQWPEPKDGEPRLHIKEQPAPVVPDERAAFNAWNNDVDCPLAGRDAKSAAWMAWNYRATLQAGNSPVIPDGWIPCSDRMPENSGAYLCFIEDEDEPELQCLVFEWLQPHRKFSAAGLKITHWMPLPKTPKQEKK
ncbi:TPA: DUF550 domain-containing protein [Klebsiella pneumoniae]|nr:DUF550 domain-containing protein [Klebsiella pneumoniae]HBW4866648.1 DUF550 domain-containing protein [Klebsiella pneumoniae]HBW4877764.1 DUF550 domain-containing protein [Klebsiella pneumoniae]HBW5039296.1 DUF550 domain-containing protein [Klebsiella pneumoniae]HBW5066577.1 DUF550 domain-containing protein [Klebsiella pneumoniae]